MTKKQAYKILATDLWLMGCEKNIPQMQGARVEWLVTLTAPQKAVLTEFGEIYAALATEMMAGKKKNAVKVVLSTPLTNPTR